MHLLLQADVECHTLGNFFTLYEHQYKIALQETLWSNLVHNTMPKAIMNKKIEPSEKMSCKHLIIIQCPKH